MVMTPEPLFAAVEAVDPSGPLLLLSAGGRRFDQRVARELAAGPGFSLVCGRYEGVDQRVADHLCDGELSVGDFVLAGGEAAALVVVEAVARLVPGVMGNEDSAADESFADGLLEYPQYTRPADFRGPRRAPRCCGRATTPGSTAGAGPRRCAGRSTRRPDLLDPAGRPRPSRRSSTSSPTERCAGPIRGRWPHGRAAAPARYHEGLRPSRSGGSPP